MSSNKIIDQTENHDSSINNVSKQLNCLILANPITEQTLDKLYGKIQSGGDIIDIIAKYPFEPKIWLKWFHHYESKGSRDALRVMRLVIQTGTFNACENFKYKYYKSQKDFSWIPLGSFQDTSSSAQQTIMYDFSLQKDYEHCDVNNSPKKKSTSLSTATTTTTTTATLPTSSTSSTSSTLSTSSSSSKFDSNISDLNSGNNKKDKIQTIVQVIESDCLEVALNLIKQEPTCNPLVLNMASAKRPGGGYRNGSAAQEENLFRRSNYYQVLEDPNFIFDKNRKWHYPIPEFGAIYSPSVLVFRSSEKEGYALLPEPVSLSFVAVAAYVRPKLQPLSYIPYHIPVSECNPSSQQQDDVSGEDDKRHQENHDESSFFYAKKEKKKAGKNKHIKKGKHSSLEKMDPQSSLNATSKQRHGKVCYYQLQSKFAENTKSKINSIFQVALMHGHDTLVLSSFGCGAYQNPPNHIASIFKELIYGRYKNKFRRIVFAIIDDHNTRKNHNPDGNFYPFKCILGGNHKP